MWLDRYSHIRKVHQNAYDFTGNYIPLGISMKDYYSNNSFEFFKDHEKMFENEMIKAQAVKSIASDMIPCIVLRFDPVLIPSMFGGKVVNVGERPWVEPWMSIDDVKKLKKPSIDSGVMPRVVKAIEYFVKNAPDDVVICTPPEPFPFEIAVAMLGSSIYYEVYDRPELVEELLQIITATFIEVETLIKSLLQEPMKAKISYFGIYTPGIRMACDSIVNLSPDMIKSFLYPVFKEISNSFGRVMVHYCPTPTHKHYYVVDPILSCPDVLGIDTSGGIQYFDDSENPCRMRQHVTYIADCTFKDDKRNSINKYDPLKNLHICNNEV